MQNVKVLAKRTVLNITSKGLERVSVESAIARQLRIAATAIEKAIALASTDKQYRDVLLKLAREISSVAP